MKGYFHLFFKLCSITPILKSDGTSKVENYRSIAITLNIAKLFESLILKSIKPFFNSVLVKKQASTLVVQQSLSSVITSWMRFIIIIKFMLYTPVLTIRYLYRLIHT